MPLKGILSRPSTSGSSNKRFSVFDTSSTGSPQSQSPEKGHRKVSSLKRLSLNFTAAEQNSFPNFLTRESEHASRQRPVLDNHDGAVEGPATVAETTNNIVQVQSNPAQSGSTIQEEGDATETTLPDKSKPSPMSVTIAKHASEPQLSNRYRDNEPTESLPPPRIITTAPTQHIDEPIPRRSKDRLLPRTFNSFRKSMMIKEEDSVPRNDQTARTVPDKVSMSPPNLIRAMSENSPWRTKQDNHQMNAPPAYGDESSSALALPMTRLSESGGSEGSSASHKLYAQTTTTHFIETTTTIFKLKRNKKKKSKDKGPLFPLPDRIPHSSATSFVPSDSPSIPSRTSMSPSRKSTQNVRWQSNLSHRDLPVDSPNSSVTALTNAPLGSPGPAISRKLSTLSAQSGQSTPTTTLVPPRLGARGRSSTLGSLTLSAERLHDNVSGRNSTSTTGRRSFGDLLTQRLRKDSGPAHHGSAHSASTPGSKANSFQIARDAGPELVYPRREEEDTPATYLEKLEAAVPRGAMATILCKTADEFGKICLRKYMRGFSFFGEALDMSVRKMLMEVILPKETQQIDRLLSAFADRYHECNPGIFMNADETNFVSFSILLLQSDSHNKNNKRKMTKQDYIKNTQNGGITVADDILDCFYDNICYTPFIHFDDEVAINSHRLVAPKRRGLIKSKSTEILRGPVDPYTLILEHKLEVLRPSLSDVFETEDPYSSAPINTSENHRAFIHGAVLQIVSARSRPDAFTNQATITNPAEAQVGLVSIKVAKVGLLWRKSTKKKKTKSAWQEWGAILTDSKLYFFKDVSWLKRLITQYEAHPKTSSRPLVFKPALTSFEPDAWMPLDDTVALIDASYKRHKNAFTFIKHGSVEEVFLANTDAETTDWISKLNYAATFRTAGVRMRGLLGTNYDGRNIYRKDSQVSTVTDISQASEKDGPVYGKTNTQLTWEIMFYRRQLVSQKISTLEDHITSAQKELNHLLQNARHLLILLPIQQKTREAIILAAGRMSAKLKWTRKEVWRAKMQRNVLLEDLEAEATSAFPAPTPARGVSMLSTPSKPPPQELSRTDTDQTVVSSATKSTAIMASPASVASRRPSQAILEQIVTAKLDVHPNGRKRSDGSVVPISLERQPAGDGTMDTRTRASTPSLRTENSQPMSPASLPDRVEADGNDRVQNSSGMLSVDHNDVVDSEADRNQSPKHNLPNSLSSEHSFKGVRKSLQRTLRDSSNHVHMPHHHRSKKGKESGSSLGAGEDGKSVTSGDSEELKRTSGHFILHGKKASVIQIGHDWQTSSEDRMRLREQLLADKATSEKRTSLHVDTNMYNSERKNQSVDELVDVSPTAELPEGVPRSSLAADSTRLSIYSAVTGPMTPGEVFHSAESSPRLAPYDTEDGSDQDLTIVKDNPEELPSILKTTSNDVARQNSLHGQQVVN